MPHQYQQRPATFRAALAALVRSDSRGLPGSILRDRGLYAWNFAAPDRDTDARVIEVIADRLEAASKMFSQERLSHSEERKLIGRPRNPMAFVRIDQIRYRDVVLLHCADDLIGLGLVDAWIVCAVDDHQRTLDLIDKVQRRALV